MMKSKFFLVCCIVLNILFVNTSCTNDNLVDDGSSAIDINIDPHDVKEKVAEFKGYQAAEDLYYILDEEVRNSGINFKKGKEYESMVVWLEGKKGVRLDIKKGALERLLVFDESHENCDFYITSSMLKIGATMEITAENKEVCKENILKTTQDILACVLIFLENGGELKFGEVSKGGVKKIVMPQVWSEKP